MANDMSSTDNKRVKFKKPSAMKLALIFVIFCILCSFICNILLYRRIVKLQKEIDALSYVDHTIETII